MASKTWRTDYDRIQLNELVIPNYKNAHMMAMLNGVDKFRITFAISPSSLTEQRSNNYQVNKTNGGYFIQRMGPNPLNLSWDGYMLDVEDYLEKHQFLRNWESFMKDKRSSSMEYENPYSLKFVCMGREYYGLATSLSINTNAGKPYLHQYQMSFTALKERYIYKPDQQMVNTAPDYYEKVPKTRVVGDSVFEILKG